jgi:hypothetical protein
VLDTAPPAQPARTLSRTEELVAAGDLPRAALPLHYVENALRSASQGLTFGFGDELAGVSSGVGALLTGEDVGAAYRTTRDAERARMRQFETDEPAASALGNVGGGLITGVAPARAVAAAPSFVGRVGRSIPAGAGYGGVAGFGVGEGDVGQQAESAGRGALTGAIAAPLITAGAAGLSRVGNLLPKGPVTRTVDVPSSGAGQSGAVTPGPRAGTSEVTARDRALDFVADTMRRAGVTVDDIERQLVNAEDLGLKPEVLADFLGDQGARRLYTARSLGGPEASAAVERLALRGEGTAARVSDDVQRATAQRGQSLSQLDQRIENRRALGNTLYREAYRHGEITNPDTLALMQNPRVADILKKAADRRAQVADLRGEPYQPLFKAGENGPALARTPTVEDLHLLKTSLDDDIRQAFQSGEGQLGGALRDFKNRIVRNLEDEVPAYRKARETYKGDIEIEDAITNGRADILRKPVDELRRDFAALSGAEKDAYRSGAIDAILARKVDPKVDSADFARSLWGNADSRNRLQLLVKDEAELVRLARQFEREQRMARTNRGVLGGSQTAMRATDIDDQTAQTLADVATQGPSGAFVTMVGKWVRRAGGMTEAVADDVAKLLTGESPETIRAVMRTLKERDQMRIALAMRQGQAAKATAATSAQQTTGNP